MPPPPRPPSSHAEHVCPPPRFPTNPQFSLTARTIAGTDSHTVVGTSYRQPAFAQFIRARLHGGAGVEFVTAQMVLDPNNPHDPNAVAVWAGQSHLGYIPATEAPSWHAVIRELNEIGRAAACHAIITGGNLDAAGEPDDDLGLEFFAESPPRRLHAGDPTIVRPYGARGRISIVGEENCQELLFSFHNAGEPEFAANLSIGTGGLVLASHHGTELGHMTPKMSTNYAPVVSAMIALGWPATCTAMVQPAQNKLEVLLKLPTSDALTAASVDLGLARE